MLTLYDAARCPYCARVRIALAEKGIEYETVEIDLRDRPAWLYEKNPLGKVPVIEEDTFVLPESAVIMEYLEERYPEPALLPADPAARALARLRVFRFDNALGDAYYAFRRGEDGAGSGSTSCLVALDQWVDGDFGLVEIAYAAVADPRCATCSAWSCPRASPGGSTSSPSGRRSRPSSRRSPRFA